MIHTTTYLPTHHTTIESPAPPMLNTSPLTTLVVPLGASIGEDIGPGETLLLVCFALAGLCLLLSALLALFLAIWGVIVGVINLVRLVVSRFQRPDDEITLDLSEIGSGAVPDRR